MNRSCHCFVEHASSLFVCYVIHCAVFRGLSPQWGLFGEVDFYLCALPGDAVHTDGRVVQLCRVLYDRKAETCAADLLGVAFIDAVKPEYSVICCGTGNKYRHPRQSLLDRLKAANNKVFRTDTNGDIVLSVSAEEDYKISVERFYVEKSDMSKNFIGGDVVAE